MHSPFNSYFPHHLNAYAHVMIAVLCDWMLLSFLLQSPREPCPKVISGVAAWSRTDNVWIKFFLPVFAEESWSSMPVSWCLAVTDNGEFSLYSISHKQPSWIYLMPKPITLQEGNTLPSLWEELFHSNKLPWEQITTLIDKIQNQYYYISDTVNFGLIKTIYRLNFMHNYHSIMHTFPKYEMWRGHM